MGRFLLFAVVAAALGYGVYTYLPLVTQTDNDLQGMAGDHPKAQFNVKGE